MKQTRENIQGYITFVEESLLSTQAELKQSQDRVKELEVALNEAANNLDGWHTTYQDEYTDEEDYEITKENNRFRSIANKEEL